MALRLWCCLCGAGIVPFAFLTMKEMGVSVLGCVFGSALLVFGTFCFLAIGAGGCFLTNVPF